MDIYSRIKELIGDKPESVFVEIGANEGEEFGKIFPLLNEPLYVAFEPNPISAKKIKESPYYDKIVFYQCAVGDKNEKCELYMSSGNQDPNGVSWGGSSSLAKPTGHLETFPWCRFDEKATVNCVTLDSLIVLEDRIVDFAWIDVQGYSHKVFIGGQKTLQNTRYLFTEYYPDDQILYEGQKSLKELLLLLPSPENWSIIDQYPNDILLKNNNLC